MVQSNSSWQTAEAQKYLAQLCKHFGHKIEVVHTERDGECRFACGTALLHAHEDRLDITVSAPDDEQLQQTQSVIERHLVTFAYRENLEALEWRPAAQSTDQDDKA
ncbi:conserved protein of unknown function (plasmid) [Pseudorhizobium banfieldiae]|uniref:DUF2218 domain-containing protein n=2 Tax=Pseudorhizobium TaxID=1903858 RepID=L0NNM6_9HYPH|nr:MULTISPECIES: DUF2218 domain-containing protein [Pseudorhizobium]CAD6628627.1 hypothetical protein RNT25_04177 [arsenite-oxidising bacterium NT-25]CAD7054225.1 hypothetical protein RHAB21_04619 [Pseudorhizobium halotolerans]CCF22167.1 conserved protein of unknown function [Pseudorhizobium banfieldiae]